MRVLLCGGGTAGHVMPAIAIAEIIEKSFPEAVIAFAGRNGGPENDAYIKTKHRLYTIDICGLRRSISINGIKSILKIIKSSRNARIVISNFNPDLIIGTGGYVCYPFIKQGQRMNIKTVIHESNVAPGLVTRLLGTKCDALLLNFDGTKRNLRKTDNAITVGTPTRKDFDYITKAEAKRRLGIQNGQSLVVSFGGSLGSDILNETILRLMSRYNTSYGKIRHIHATGRVHYEKMREKYPNLFKSGKSITILPYIDDMPLLLSAADLAISRSGAITISELAKTATPSILIPSPNVTANHQYFNAKYMQDIGAATLIEENDLTVENLEEAMTEIIENRDKITRMSECAKKAYTKNTDKLITSVITELIKR